MGLLDIVKAPFKAVVDTLGGLLDKLGPFQMLLGFLPPPFNALALLPLIINVGRALTSDPPNWGAALTGALMAAVPFGMGKAFQMFKAAGGGPASKFGEFFSKHMGEKLDLIKDQALKTKGITEATKGRFTEMIEGMKTKFKGKEFQDDLATKLETSTGTPKGGIVKPETLTDEAAGSMVKSVAGSETSKDPNSLIQAAATNAALAQLNRTQQQQVAKQGVSTFKPLTEAEIMAEVNSSLAPFQVQSNAPIMSSRPPTIVP